MRRVPTPPSLLLLRLRVSMRRWESVVMRLVPAERRKQSAVAANEPPHSHSRITPATAKLKTSKHKAKEGRKEGKAKAIRRTERFSSD